MNQWSDDLGLDKMNPMMFQQPPMYQVAVMQQAPHAHAHSDDTVSPSQSMVMQQQQHIEFKIPMVPANHPS